MKILIISSIPTHPTTAGNCNFIKKYCTLLKQMGYDIYFLHISLLCCDKTRKKKYRNSH